MGRATHALLLGGALAVLFAGHPTAAQPRPWISTRHFPDKGSSDDVAFAGLPDSSGGFVTTGRTSCACDLTENACDAFCCCDPACSSFETDTLFDCTADAKNATARPGTSSCAASAAVISANLPSTAGAAWDPQAGDSLERVLCVAVDNSPSYGRFAAPLLPLDESASAELQVANSSFATTQAQQPALETSDAHYAPGARLRKGTSSTKPSEFGAPASLPSARAAAGAASAACDDRGPVAFLENVPPTACVTSVTAHGAVDVGELCVAGSVLDAAALAAVRVGNGGLSPADSGYKAISVSVRSLHDLPLGGTDYTALSTAALQPPSLANSSDNSSLVCDNVLTGAYFRFLYDGDGLITRIDAYVTVSSVPAESTQVPRAFGAVFQKYDEDVADSDVRPRSGRPGYLSGLPVLSAAEDGDGAFTPSVLGLVGLVSSSLGGICQTAATLPVLPPAAGGGLQVDVVNYGEDAILSCEFGYTPAQLQAACSAGAQPFVLDALVDDYVGRFGDSSGDTASDWLKVDKSSPGDPSWDAASDECSNLIVGADLTFLTARFGAAVDPQASIVGAKLRYRTGTWELGASRRQLFTVTTSFIEVPNGGFGDFVPPTPSLFAPLPDDVFYPFTVNLPATASLPARTASAQTRSA